jgi:hypothetical protein
LNPDLDSMVLQAGDCLHLMFEHLTGQNGVTHTIAKAAGIDQITPVLPGDADNASHRIIGREPQTDTEIAGRYGCRHFGPAQGDGQLRFRLPTTGFLPPLDELPAFGQVWLGYTPAAWVV